MRQSLVDQDQDDDAAESRRESKDFGTGRLSALTSSRQALNWALAAAGCSFTDSWDIYRSVPMCLLQLLGIASQLLSVAFILYKMLVDSKTHTKLGKPDDDTSTANDFFYWILALVVLLWPLAFLHYVTRISDRASRMLKTTG